MANERHAYRSRASLFDVARHGTHLHIVQGASLKPQDAIDGKNLAGDGMRAGGEEKNRGGFFGKIFGK